MTPQLTTIEVSQTTALLLQALQGRAAAQGVTIDSLLRPLVENGSPLNDERPFYETATPEEWVKEFLDWANNRDRNTAGLTFEDISRESIYEDR